MNYRNDAPKSEKGNEMAPNNNTEGGLTSDRGADGLEGGARAPRPYEKYDTTKERLSYASPSCPLSGTDVIVVNSMHVGEVEDTLY